MTTAFDKQLAHLAVKPGSAAHLDRRDPGDSLGVKDKKTGRARTARLLGGLPSLQLRLHAEQRQALLVVLQAMDAGGKDGVIRRVFSIMNPQGCRVVSFKAPTADEQARDFLWRIHRAVPAAGEIGVFNRSHYEDVLIVRVQNLAPRSLWSHRYRQINDFERLLSENGVRILKCYLHLSQDEQRLRLQARIDNPEKNWKFDPADARERRHWDDYRKAYEEALTRCSTSWAPWHVIPADRKWVRDLAVAALVRRALEDMNPVFPAPAESLEGIEIE